MSFSLQDLLEDLKSELSSNFEQVILGMMTPTVLYDVQELRRAMKVGGPLELLVSPVHRVMSHPSETRLAELGYMAQWLQVFAAHTNHQQLQL